MDFINHTKNRSYADNNTVYPGKNYEMMTKLLLGDAEQSAQSEKKNNPILSQIITGSVSI